MNKRNYQILKYLKETEEYVTSETLSAMNNVSTKTILKDIKSLNCDMKATDNYIEVTPSRGIKLVINDIEEFINLCKILYLIFDYPHKHYTFKYFEV